MSLYTDRERDAATIKPRTFKIELSDSDAERFLKLAKEYGTTPAEILQGFICDLVDGTQTRGSDERDLAQRYFDRCCYDLGISYTFLTWLVKEGCIDTVSELLKTADSAADVEEREEAEQEIADFYREYTENQERRREPAQGMQEGLEEIRTYIAELKTIAMG